MLKSRQVPNIIIPILILLLAFGLRVFYLTEDRFHADEALYAGWALRILDGDPLLLDVPVDKPPLFLYALAGAFKLFGRSEVAARWISLACSMVGIASMYRLAKATQPARASRSIEETSAALWAAFFLALSPFDVLFGRTVFTDSMLVMWILAALCTAVKNDGFWTGILTGLAFATKQHAVVLIPLIVAVQVWSGQQPRHRFDSSHIDVERGAPSPWSGGLGRFAQVFERRLKSRLDSIWTNRVMRSILTSALGFLFPWSMVTWWDSARWQIRPGYWDQSALSYGGGLVGAPIGEWGARFIEWLGWARYLAGSTLAGIAFVIGAAALLIWQWRHHPRARQTWLDTLWAATILIYLVFHSVIAFGIWDRYLLPLTVPVALLAARIVTCVDCGLGQMKQRPHAANVAYNGLAQLQGAVPYFVIGIVLAFGIRAATNQYPIGGEHWAYQGLDQVTDYLKENAAPDAVLYHHWLRWHYTYYLHGTPFELRWWQDGAHLRQEARKSSDREQYIVLPTWRPLDPNIDGVRFVPLLETHRKNGSTSLLLCRIELEPWHN